MTSLETCRGHSDTFLLALTETSNPMPKYYNSVSPSVYLARDGLARNVHLLPEAEPLRSPQK